MLSAAFLVLDRASLRVGSEQYARRNGTFGLATMRRDHVSVDGRTVTFHYTAKGGQESDQCITSAPLARVVGELVSRRDGGPELLAWLDGDGWHDVTSATINQGLGDLVCPGFTAKDFRTWNATVLMAQTLAFAGRPSTASAREAVVREAYATVADYLGNTVAVARSAYVDPRVVDRFREGAVVPSSALPSRDRDLPVHAAVERHVVAMLSA